MSRSEVSAALERVTGALDNPSVRAGQQAMAEAVAHAIASGRHLVVQAGTGTGKGFAYLIPAILSGRTTVVATVTKALQEQLVRSDLPFLERHLGVPFTSALLKGRSNYLCRAALADAVVDSAQAKLFGPTLDAESLAAVIEWTATTSTGDRADLAETVTDAEWSKLSVGVGECPGARNCSYGEVCFAEDARAAAAEADVVVVNTHLYAAHLASDNMILPDHDVVVIDEAHAFEDVAGDALGATVGPYRVEQLARAARGLFSADHPAISRVEAAGTALAGSLGRAEEGRVRELSDDLAASLVAIRGAIDSVTADARSLDIAGDPATRRDRLVQAAGHLVEDVNTIVAPDDESAASVMWIEAGPAGSGVLRRTPVDVGSAIAARLFAETTVVLTSATLSIDGRFDHLVAGVGLDHPDAGGGFDTLDAGSPFDHHAQSLLYCAAHLPDPRAETFEAAMLVELEDLIRAAGGRTLALFTSRRALTAAADHLRGRLPFPVLVQDELPRPVLHERFLAEETSVLLATMSFWQGFDAPGPTCSLVVIDRLPFARPDDPISQARREAATRARRNAFLAVDLPRAAVLLAQGVGRLLRRTEDEGVVAVLDRRLATAGYRWSLVNSLPPMRRTKDPTEARARLSAIVAGRSEPEPVPVPG